MFELHASAATAKKKMPALAVFSDLKSAEKKAERIGKKATSAPVIVYVPPVVV